MNKAAERKFWAAALTPLDLHRLSRNDHTQTSKNQDLGANIMIGKSLALGCALALLATLAQAQPASVRND